MPKHFLTVGYQQELTVLKQCLRSNHCSQLEAVIEDCGRVDPAVIARALTAHLPSFNVSCSMNQTAAAIKQNTTQGFLISHKIREAPPKETCQAQRS
jgi:hypothetical protein